MSNAKNTNGFLDISVEIGPLWGEQLLGRPHQMYSYERPASELWCAIANELYQRGWTKKEIFDWLKSKEPRWALDGTLGTKLRELAVEYAKTIDDGGEQ
jgi:hypothetical protein